MCLPTLHQYLFCGGASLGCLFFDGICFMWPVMITFDCTMERTFVRCDDQFTI